MSLWVQVSLGACNLAIKKKDKIIYRIILNEVKVENLYERVVWLSQSYHNSPFLFYFNLSGVTIVH